jgi:MFS family permease
MGEDTNNLNFAISCEGILSVPSQFIHDSRTCLLAPFVFGFGITTAMFCFYVNCNLVSYSTSLGIAFLGLFESFSYLIAILAAYPYAYISNTCANGTYFVMQFGSFSFLVTGLILLLFSTSQLSQWWMVLLMKAFYGFGRGVFEGSCRAVYADLFSGDTLMIAFSGQTLLAGLSGGVCFFVFSVLNKLEISYITIINGLFAILGYYILDSLKKSPYSWSRLCRCIFYRDKLFSSTRVIDEYNDSYYETDADYDADNNNDNLWPKKGLSPSYSYSSLDMSFEAGTGSISMGSPYSSFLNLPKLSRVSTKSSMNLNDL